MMEMKTHSRIFFVLIMTQPITSKLAVIAERMNEFTRVQNALLLAELRQTSEDVLFHRRLNNELIAQVLNLEQDLRTMEDDNHQLQGQVYALETELLMCREPPASPVPSLADSEMTEIIDLTHEEE